jgi:DNA-binding Lrp family transcriptional regulator
MGRSETFSNPGTSKVFLCIVKGITNPKAIADFLNIKPPPVIQQLRRLQKIGLVKLGTKVGKEQKYEIVWISFLNLFLDNAVKERVSPNDIPISSAEKEKLTITEIRSLKNNKYFAQFTHFYLDNIVETDDFSRWPTVSALIENVEKIMPHFSRILSDKKTFNDLEKQEFFDKMNLWYTRVTTVASWSELNVHDALQKTLYPDRPRHFK